MWSLTVRLIANYVQFTGWRQVCVLLLSKHKLFLFMKASTCFIFWLMFLQHQIMLWLLKSLIKIYNFGSCLSRLLFSSMESVSRSSCRGGCRGAFGYVRWLTFEFIFTCVSFWRVLVFSGWWLQIHHWGYIFIIFFTFLFDVGLWVLF